MKHPRSHGELLVEDLNSINHIRHFPLEDTLNGKACYFQTMLYISNLQLGQMVKVHVLPKVSGWTGLIARKREQQEWPMQGGTSEEGKESNPNPFRQCLQSREISCHFNVKPIVAGHLQTTGT